MKKKWLLGLSVCVLPTLLWAGEPGLASRARTAASARRHDQPRYRRSGASRVGPGVERQPHPLATDPPRANRRSVDLDAYQKWLQSALQQLDRALPLCEKYGLRVVVDLHSPPGGHTTSGGYAGSDYGLFTDAACQRKFVEVWQEMRGGTRACKTIWGYDLANEPVEPAAGEALADWQDLAERAAQAIRAIDPQRTLIVEPRNGGTRRIRRLRPLTVSNVVYSVHMYLPDAFTHQGVPVAATGVATRAKSAARCGTRRGSGRLRPVVESGSTASRSTSASSPRSAGRPMAALRT